MTEEEQDILETHGKGFKITEKQEEYATPNYPKWIKAKKPKNHSPQKLRINPKSVRSGEQTEGTSNSKGCGKVLVACEESQEVCKAFRELGYEAYSCDILPCSGGHPEWHIQDDVLKHLNDGWDLMIAHPPCTFLSRAGTRWLFPNHKLNKERHEKGIKAKEFFMKLLNADIPRIVVENPVPHKIFDMPKETQMIQPYEFGHPFTKRTLLWLKGLPELKPTKIVEPEYYIDKKGRRHSKFTANWDAKKKSKTFLGIAKAMAKQWGKVLCPTCQEKEK